MKEQRWLASEFPQAMLSVVRSQASARKLRFYACACCRVIWHLFTDQRSRNAVEVAERHADGLATSQELASARQTAWDVAAARGTYDALLERGDTASFTEMTGGFIGFLFKGVPALGWRGVFGSSDKSAADDAADAAAVCASEKAWDATNKVLSSASFTGKGFLGSVQLDPRFAAILRCLFGNPFSPCALPNDLLNWQGGLVGRLAQAAYDERILPAGTLDNARLAVLADALEEAGCTVEQILTHLRGGGEHYRGCFVVDLLLGKS